MNRLSMFGAVAVMGMAGLANAAQITYNAPYTINPIGGAASPVLPYFTGNLADLTNVTIWFDGDMTGAFTFVIGAAPTDTATATLSSVVFAAYTPTGTNLFDNSISTGSQGPLNATESVHVGIAGGTINLGAVAYGDGPDAEALAPYVGVGNFAVNLTSTGGWTFQVNGSGETGSATVSFNSALGGDVYVRYDYIPEPASLGLLAVGGLALIRRRSAR